MRGRLLFGNVEMGFLITREENPEAYEKMMEDIDYLRINGEYYKHVA